MALLLQPHFGGRIKKPQIDSYDNPRRQWKLGRGPRTLVWDGAQFVCFSSCVEAMRALPFRVYTRAPDFGELTFLSITK